MLGKTDLAKSVWVSLINLHHVAVSSSMWKGEALQPLLCGCVYSVVLSPGFYFAFSMADWHAETLFLTGIVCVGSGWFSVGFWRMNHTTQRGHFCSFPTDPIQVFSCRDSPLFLKIDIHANVDRLSLPHPTHTLSHTHSLSPLCCIVRTK